MGDRGLEDLLPRIERVLDLVEVALREHVAGTSRIDPPPALAYRWHRGRLHPIAHPDVYPLDGLIGVERSVARLRANAEAFVRGEPALDVLLYGERGTGKSSAVRGLLGVLGDCGLRLVEIARDDLFELWEVFAALRGRPGRFVLFCDDLSFEEGDASYKRLKAVLDGGLEARPENVLIAATSNRRHLLPEHMSENLEARLDASGQLHPGETTEEKLSLSDRFGLLLPFFAFDQARYLEIVDHHAARMGLVDRLPGADLHRRSLRFALDRGTRSGRTARQACIAILQEIEGETR
jgi:predicted AAA+ superfamily ATPase